MDEAFKRPIDRGEVALHDRLPPLGVGRLDEALDPRDRLVGGQDPGQLEEARLHDGVDPAAHAGLLGYRQSVDDPEVDLLVEDHLLHVLRQVIPDVIGPVGGIEQERRAVLGRREHVDLPE